ncbi:hypothetical protein TIFTF001_050923 [Ficus carica]|uniref:Leucine-rich repeat-containing N-terminal plant-type domain-containing protein n=1 Tax=Ficus carica TaxID=3494 RepID=A0AA87YP48_FICCA|nr:hypothetical protein TIFTF001_050923 [Ficus carica]
MSWLSAIFIAPVEEQPTFLQLLNWNESSECCSWEGVACEEGRVTHLDLSDEGIYGRLDNSSTLFNLQHLKSLDLSYNYFYSTIPSRIGNLTNLSLLNLSFAGFRGEVPVSISRLRSLVTLDLSFSATWVAETNLVIPNLKMLVQNLSKLQELRLDGSKSQQGAGGVTHYHPHCLTFVS